jgi:hypothetical protein
VGNWQRRLKDYQTSLRYLARALGHASPEQCRVEAVAPLAPAEWKATLDAYFLALPQPPSVHTVRNTRNNLSFLFRQAAAHGLLPTATASPRLALTRKAREQLAVGRSPFAARVRAANAAPYALAFADWPPAIRAGWEAYHASRQRKTRAISLNHYRAVLGRYLGFLQTTAAVPLTWETVFDPARIDQYVGWHCQRAPSAHDPPSVSISAHPAHPGAGAAPSAGRGDCGVRPGPAPARTHASEEGPLADAARRRTGGLR